MEKGVFYSIGVGPGDPRLMTYKAVDTMNNCSVIVVPKSGGKENIALKIAGEFLTGQEIIEIDMPMTRDKKLLEISHNNACTVVSEFLENGKNVAFLTLGDPSVYSTAMYVHQKLENLGFKTKIIPGVPSFCAVAASLNTTLCENGQPLHIIPASYKHDDDVLKLSGNKVFMKSGKTIGALRDKLSSENSNNEMMMVECASMENEKIYRSIEDIGNDHSYFSIILVKENKGENI